MISSVRSRLTMKSTGVKNKSLQKKCSLIILFKKTLRHLDKKKVSKSLATDKREQTILHQYNITKYITVYSHIEKPENGFKRPYRTELIMLISTVTQIFIELSVLKR